MLLQKIDKFEGEHRWLSNFWLVRVYWRGVWWSSSEHAYQASKFDNPDIVEQIWLAETPGKTKWIARKYASHIRPNFHEEKRQIMREILAAKFQDQEMREKLLATGDAVLIEGNTWGDVYWGVCDGKGENWLGILLMNVREEIKGK